MILLSFLLITSTLTSQNLLDIYKTGKVRLVADKEYASVNNWEKIFVSYYDTVYGKPMANRKSIVLLPDGSVVVNHAYRNYYSLFNPKGLFVKDFNIRKPDGEVIKSTKSITGVLDGKILLTDADNMGKILCTDLEGNYIKTLTLDYMVKGMVPLPGRKIAVAGWVIWKDKFRDFVAIVDYETNDQKVIWEHFTERGSANDRKKMFNYTYRFENGTSIGLNTMPYSGYTGMSIPPRMEYLNNNLIISIPSDGDILVYDLNGNLLRKEKVDWQARNITVEEQKEIQNNFITKYQTMDESKYAAFGSAEEGEKAKQTIISQMEEDLGKISKPINIPYFSNIIKDSDGNLLFFEFPREEGENRFNVWVFQETGRFICQSSFICDDYDLSITPGKMVFRDGYIYALQELRNASGNPLRLVRFRLTSE